MKMLRINKLKPRERQSTSKSETPHISAVFFTLSTVSLYISDALETVLLTRCRTRPISHPIVISIHWSNGNKTRVCKHDHCA